MIKLLFCASPHYSVFLLRLGIKIALFLRCKPLKKVGLMISHPWTQNAKCSEKVYLFSLFRLLPFGTVFSAGNELCFVTLLAVMYAISTTLVKSASACLWVNEKIPFLFFFLAHLRHDLFTSSQRKKAYCSGFFAALQYAHFVVIEFEI